jgi:hypothetical protein
MPAQRSWSDWKERRGEEMMEGGLPSIPERMQTPVSLGMASWHFGGCGGRVGEERRAASGGGEHVCQVLGGHVLSTGIADGTGKGEGRILTGRDPENSWAPRNLIRETQRSRRQGSSRLTPHPRLASRLHFSVPVYFFRTDLYIATRARSLLNSVCRT